MKQTFIIEVKGGLDSMELLGMIEEGLGYQNNIKVTEVKE